MSDARESSLHEVLNEGRKVEPTYSLDDALLAYRSSRACKPLTPEFLDEEKNKGNRPTGELGRWLPPGGVNLVTLLDLSRLITLFQRDWLRKTQALRFQEFKDVPVRPDLYSAWLEKAIQGQGRSFLLKVLQLLNEDLKQSERKPGPGVRIYPCWACVAGDADSNDPAVWCQTVGMLVSSLLGCVCCVTRLTGPAHRFDRRSWMQG